jgi:YHS domain-containing protein
MKTCLMIAIATLLGATTMFAADKPTTRPATQPAASAAAVNKICAVEGGDHTVDPEFFVMYKSQKIGFCCKDCIKEFEADPDKYVAELKARKDGIK